MESLESFLQEKLCHRNRGKRKKRYLERQPEGKKLRQNSAIIIVLVFKVAKELSDGANYEQHDEKKNLG